MSDPIRIKRDGNGPSGISYPIVDKFDGNRQTETHFYDRKDDGKYHANKASLINSDNPATMDKKELYQYIKELLIIGRNHEPNKKIVLEVEDTTTGEVTKFGDYKKAIEYVDDKIQELERAEVVKAAYGLDTVAVGESNAPHNKGFNNISSCNQIR